MIVVITTQPFNKELISELEGSCSVLPNNTGKKYSQDEANSVLKKENPDLVIAGTEKYGATQFDLAPNLKMIVRVGAGTDSIDFNECKKRNIRVSNVPDAHIDSVSELIIGGMLAGLRKIPTHDRSIKNGVWHRTLDRTIADSKIGLIGYGKVGKSVYEKVQSFKPKMILIHDAYQMQLSIGLDQLLRESDIISISVPLTQDTQGLIGKEEFDKMKENAILINTSRGGIINEGELFKWLTRYSEAAAVIDTFEEEPYSGPLSRLNNTILTPHSGGATVGCRLKMEKEAVDEAVRFLQKESLKNEIV